MTIGGIHLIDILVVAGYLVIVTYLGHRAAKGNRNEDDFFLAGRELGKLYQFFLNFGNATDANGAVSTASLVYQQGVSGVWLSLQTLFMNPYYWFMNLWFRRVRLATVNVPFGAAVILIFTWRRLTPGAVWTAVIVSALVNIIAPFVVPMVPALRQHPALVELAAAGATGRRDPVYFESVVRSRPDDLASPLEGRGRFHLELYLLDRVGIDMTSRSSSARFAARFFFDGLFPFALLLLVSLRTRAPVLEHVDQFYGKMKTPVGATPELEATAMAETRRDPHRFDRLKLFPRSAWEFTKWDRVDTIGFVVCCAVSGGILWVFALLLRAAAG